MGTAETSPAPAAAPVVADETASAPAPALKDANSRQRLFLLFIAIIFSVGLLVLVTWFSFKPIKPYCSLLKFYIPGLNNASNDFQTMNSTVVSFELSFRNRNRNKSYYFDDVKLTVYYYRNSLRSPIGNTSIPAFYQRYLRTKDYAETTQTFGVPWEDIRMKVSNGNTAVFRVELETKVRYKNGVWKTKRHMLKLGVDVTVNDRGMKSTKSSLRLI